MRILAPPGPSRRAGCAAIAVPARGAAAAKCITRRIGPKPQQRRSSWRIWTRQCSAPLFFIFAVLIGARANAASTTGYPRQVLWIVLAGSSTAEIHGDIESLTLTHQYLYGSSGLLTVLAPLNSPLALRDGIIRAPVEALLESMTLNGPVVRRARRDGFFERPHVVVLYVASHGTADGNTLWGNQEITPGRFAALVEGIRSGFHAPTIVFLDKCHADASESLLRHLAPTTRDGLFVISASSNGKNAHAFTQTWTEAWTDAPKVWPRLSDTPVDVQDAIRKIFRPDSLYSEAALDISLALLGAASDPNRDGLDAADVCDFLAQSALGRGRAAQIRCPPRASRPALDFALTTTRLQIAIERGKTELLPGQRSALEALRTAFKDVASDLDINRWVDICDLEMNCNQPDWRCTVELGADQRWSTICSDTSHVSPDVVDAPVNAPEALIPGLDDLARKVLRPSWHPPSTGGRDPVVALRAPGDHVILVDQSLSMRTADPEGRKRFAFFDHVVTPLLRNGTIRRLDLLRFSNTNQRKTCVSPGQKSAIAEVRRCYLQTPVDEGSTDLAQALSSVAGQLQRGTTVWLLTDAEQTRTPATCERHCTRYLALTSCWRRPSVPEDALETADGYETRCSVDRIRSNEAAYYGCVQQTLDCTRAALAAAGRKIERAGGHLRAIFLEGPGTDVTTATSLDLLGDPRGSIVILPDLPEKDLQVRFVEIATRVTGTSSQTIPMPRPVCHASIGGKRCNARLKVVALSPHQRDLTIHWGSSRVQDVAFRIRLVRIDAIIAAPEAYAVKSIASHETKLVHPAGFTILIDRSATLASIQWTPDQHMDSISEWEIEIEYSRS